MEKQTCKMLKPGDVVYPVRGVFIGKKCFVVDVKLGDQRIGMVWVEVKMEETQTHMLFGSEDISDKKPAPKPEPEQPEPEQPSRTQKEQPKRKKNRGKRKRGKQSAGGRKGASL